jgi:hypothetical protein
MKKSILLTALIGLSFAVSAQSKHIAPVNNITLTDQQLIAIEAKLDTLQQLILQTKQPSDFIQSLNIRTYSVFKPLWIQVQKQMVADTVKKPKNTKQ